MERKWLILKRRKREKWQYSKLATPLRVRLSDSRIKDVGLSALPVTQEIEEVRDLQYPNGVVLLQAKQVLIAAHNVI